MDLKALLPKDKFDTESVANLYKYNFTELKPIAHELLNWTADGHWQIASLIADYLRPNISQLTEEIIEVFKSNDDFHIRFMISFFFLNVNFKINSRIISELKKVKECPSKFAVEAELNILATEVLEQQKLI